MIKYVLLGLALMLLSGCSDREKRESSFSNGQIRERYYVKQIALGKIGRDGKYMSWYESGQRCSEAEYEDDLLQGTATAWYPNGQKGEEGEYERGEKHGQWTWWYDNGQKREEGEYGKGKENGTWIRWYTNGSKWSEREYQWGIQKGRFAEWFPDGKKKAEGEMKNMGILEDGSLAGAALGKWTRWHPNGQKQVEGEYNRHSKLHGTVFAWYDDGTKAYESVYDDGIQRKAIVYFANGRKRLEADMTGGRESATVWLENGEKVPKDYIAWRTIIYSMERQGLADLMCSSPMLPDSQ